MADVVDKAQGVFLWVRLMVLDLLHGLRNQDGIEDLRRKLKALPAVLEEYFSHMMSTLDKSYLNQACYLFKMAKTASSKPSLMTCSFLNEEDPDYAIKALVTPLTEMDLHARCKSAERRLNSRCKGQLEVHHLENESLYFSGEVDFLHRSVKDFLCTGVLSHLFAVTEYEAFDVNPELYKSLLTQMKSKDKYLVRYWIHYNL